MDCPAQIAEELKDPRYKALQLEMRGINSRLDALITQGIPKPFVLDARVISKASTFTDTEIECGGFDLIKISTDGNLTDVSYKILQRDGSKSREVEASEMPQFLGPVDSVFVTNDTAEAGKNVKVTRIQASPEALAALQHGTPMAVSIASSKRLFYAEIEEYVSGAPGYFETDQAWGTLPTLSFVGDPAVLHIRIHTIKHQFTPDAAQTYKLWLLERASDVDEQSEADNINASEDAAAAGEIVCGVPGGSPAKLPVDAKLGTAGEIFYMIDWSAPPGNSSGYIKVYGEVLG